MGMFNEIQAEQQAKQLQKVLIAAIDSGDNNVVTFCKEHIYSLYNDALAEAFSPSLESEATHLFIKKCYEGESFFKKT